MTRPRVAAYFFLLAGLGYLLTGLGACCTTASAENVPTEFQPNYDRGYQIGYSTGYDSGLVTGKARGTTEGTTTGHSDGYDFGWNETYQPAFDRAYDAQYPAANREGWNVGIREGFDEGYKWAPVIYQNWINSSSSGLFISNYSSGSTIVYGGVNSTNLSISSGSLFISIGNLNYDWAGHYYDVGYTDGNGVGLTVGDSDGYELTYPVAYAAGYKTGYVDGTGAGTQQGLAAGGQLGHDEGWSAGHSTGYDAGFVAGVDYHIYGKFAQPRYALDYVRRSSALLSSPTATVPEPSSLVLAAIAACFGLLRRRAQGEPAAVPF